MIEISDESVLVARLDGGEPLVDVVLQGLNLAGLIDRLVRHSLSSTFFFGCQAAAVDLGRLIEAGASVRSSALVGSHATRYTVPPNGAARS